MIFYFSATGNSKHVAERLASALHETSMSIESAGTDIVLKEGEHLGLVTPTHWNELPILVREFIRKVNVHTSQKNYFSP